MMISFETFQTMALSLPDAIELPHFDLVSFRVNKKIFATYHHKTHRAMVKLPLIEQSVFCAYGNMVFFPVPGAWGAGGSTFVELSTVKKNMFKDALNVAYQNALKKPPSKTKRSTL